MLGRDACMFIIYAAHTICLVAVKNVMFFSAHIFECVVACCLCECLVSQHSKLYSSANIISHIMRHTSDIMMETSLQCKYPERITKQPHCGVFQYITN